MRRIIERVVTVVTTTTWTISWQDDPPTVDGNLSQPQSLQYTQQSDWISTTQTTKEDHAAETKQ